MKAGQRRGDKGGAGPAPALLRFAAPLAGRLRSGAAGKGVRVGLGILQKFDADRCFLRASALTYTTLLSLVPLLALAFSILKGLGVQRRLEPLILERFAAGNEEVVARILEYVDRTRVASLGAVGLAGLLFTVISVVGNVELSFNDIWQIRRGRTLIRKVTDYLALLVVTPVLLLVSLSLTTTLHSPALLQSVKLLGPAVNAALRGLPFAATALALTAAYLILPNRRIPLVSALLGGAVAGALWHVAEWAYVRFQFGVAGYNAIYGTMAQLPMLLVWLYTSWCIVLFGAELACLHELRGTGIPSGGAGELRVPRPSVSLGALTLVAQRFEEGIPGPSLQELSMLLRLAPGQVQVLVDWLGEAGLVVLTREEPARVVPAMTPEKVGAGELLARVTGLPEGAGETDVDARLRRGLAGEFEQMSWADLARRPTA